MAGKQVTAVYKNEDEGLEIHFRAVLIENCCEDIEITEAWQDEVSVLVTAVFEWENLGKANKVEWSCYD